VRVRVCVQKHVFTKQS